MNLYYVDTENIGSRKWDYLIDMLKPCDCIALFYSDMANNMATNTLRSLQKKGVRVKYIYSYPGRRGGNAMDFQITSILGYGIAKMGKKASYRIISNDMGYLPVATYWKKHGYDVDVIQPTVDAEDTAQRPVNAHPLPGQRTRKQVKNELIQKGIEEQDAGLIAAMMEAASKKKQDIRLVSMHSRLNEKYGKTKGDELYNKLEPYFNKVLRQQSVNVPA